jgi:hypothetical protein
VGNKASGDIASGAVLTSIYPPDMMYSMQKMFASLIIRPIELVVG